MYSARHRTWIYEKAKLVITTSNTTSTPANAPVTASILIAAALGIIPSMVCS
jgi:hypothetical protein